LTNQIDKVLSNLAQRYATSKPVWTVENTRYRIGGDNHWRNLRTKVLSE